MRALSENKGLVASCWNQYSLSLTSQQFSILTPGCQACSFNHWIRLKFVLMSSLGNAFWQSFHSSSSRHVSESSSSISKF